MKRVEIFHKTEIKKWRKEIWNMISICCCVNKEAVHCHVKPFVPAGWQTLKRVKMSPAWQFCCNGAGKPINWRTQSELQMRVMIISAAGWDICTVGLWLCCSTCCIYEQRGWTLSFVLKGNIYIFQARAELSFHSFTSQNICVCMGLTHSVELYLFSTSRISQV